MSFCSGSECLSHPLEGVIAQRPGQFQTLAETIGLSKKQIDTIMQIMMFNLDKVEQLDQASFMDDRIKRNYYQAYRNQLGQFRKWMV